MSLVEIATVVAAVGAGVTAGILFTFSDFAMRGLRRLAPERGAAAMQAINQEAPKPPLMLLLFGTGICCVYLAVQAFGNWSSPLAIYQTVAAALYVFGVILTTGLYHVPRNDKLDTFDAESPEGVAYWHTYVKQWVPMNHVRTVAPIVSCVLLMLSLRGQG